MYTTTSPAISVERSLWSLFPSEWSVSYNSCTTANDNTAHDLNQPAVSGGSALCTGVCAQVCFWVDCLLFGASCRESRFSRRCFASRAEIPNADAPKAALTAVKREKQQICLQKNTLTCFLIQDVSQYFFLNLSPSALKSISIFIVIRLFQFMCKCIQKCAAVMWF